MHKIVSLSFKTVMLSLVGFIILGVSLYLGRMWALDHKMKALGSVICSDVSKNNYLSSDSYGMYNTILTEIKDTDPNLVASIDINYGSDAQDHDSYRVVSGASKDLSKVSNYGDVKAIQIHVKVKRLAWGSERSSGAIQSASDLRGGWSYGDFYYDYTVPCLRYIK